MYFASKSSFAILVDSSVIFLIGLVMLRATIYAINTPTTIAATVPIAKKRFDMDTLSLMLSSGVFMYTKLPSISLLFMMIYSVPSLLSFCLVIFRLL